MRKKKSPGTRSPSPSQMAVRSALRSTATLQSSLREVHEKVHTMQQSQIEDAERVRAQTSQSLGELRSMMDQNQVRQQVAQQSIDQLRAEQSQQEVNVATLQQSLHDFRHDATQRSVAQDLSTRTTQYSTQKALEDHFGKQKTYLDDVIGQLRKEIDHLKVDQSTKESELKQLQNALREEKEERKRLQDYVDDVHENMMQPVGTMELDEGAEDFKVRVSDIHGALPLYGERQDQFSLHGDTVFGTEGVTMGKMYDAVPMRVPEAQHVDFSAKMPTPQVLDTKMVLPVQPVAQPVLPPFGAGIPTPVPTGPPVPPVVPASHVPMMQQPVAGTGTQMLVPVFPAAQMRPKEPPTFRGDLNEDIDAWYSLVQDYCHLMGTSEAQNVAYMATLL